MKNNNYIIYLISLLYALMMVSCATENNDPNTLKNNHFVIDKGILDLSNINFEQTKKINFNGEWQFYWKQFPLDKNNNYTTSALKNPEFIKNEIWVNNGYKITGYGTFRAHLKLPNDNERLAIQMPMNMNAYEVWANGVKIATNGTIGKTKLQTKANGKPLLVELPLEKEIDLSILVSSFSHKLGNGFYFNLNIGKSTILIKNREFNIIKEIIIVTISFVIGIFQLFLFYTTRKHKFYLYFALIAFSATLRQLFVGKVLIYNFFSEISFRGIQIGRYLTFYACLCFGILYLYELLPKQNIKIIVKFFVYCIIFGTFYVLFTPTLMATHIAPVFQILFIVITIYEFWVFIKSYRNKEPLAGEIILFTFIPIALIFNDVLLAMGFVNTIFLASYGFLSFLILQQFINYKFQKQIESKLLTLNSDVENLSHEIQIKKDKITNLMVETVQHLKNKERITNNLKKLANQKDAITLSSVLADLKSDKLEDSKALYLKNNLETLNFDFTKTLKLKHPNLSKTDIEICSFIKLGLSRTEIAKIRSTTNSAVKVARFRIRKKMALPTDVSLNDYLQNSI